MYAHPTPLCNGHRAHWQMIQRNCILVPFDPVELLSPYHLPLSPLSMSPFFGGKKHRALLARVRSLKRCVRLLTPSSGVVPYTLLSSLFLSFGLCLFFCWFKCTPPYSSLIYELSHPEQYPLSLRHTPWHSYIEKTGCAPPRPPPHRTARLHYMIFFFPFVPKEHRTYTVLIYEHRT